MRLVSRGLHITDDFEYGEPVPMSGDNVTAPMLLSTEQIRQAQARLQQLGLNPGLADGILGPSTSEALRRFQAREGLAVTGELNLSTWETLKQQNKGILVSNKSEETNNILQKKSRGWLGVQIGKLNEEPAFPRGVYVENVFPGDPADQAGIRSEDIIVSVGGQKVSSGRELANLIASLAVGQRTEIVLLRNGDEKTVSVKIAKQPTYDDKMAKPKSSSDHLGLQVTDLSPENIRQFGLGEDEKGVLVIEVENGSRADEADVKVGDVIKGVNLKNIENLEDYEFLMNRIDKKKPIKLLVRSRNQGFRGIQIKP